MKSRACASSIWYWVIIIFSPCLSSTFSMSTPSTGNPIASANLISRRTYFDSIAALEVNAITNDDFVRIVQERGPRFAALATLPLNDPKASLAELRRAVEQLKLPGAMLFSNVNGVALADDQYQETEGKDKGARRAYWFPCLSSSSSAVVKR